MFMFDQGVSKYTKWTNSENLSSNDLTALMVDRAGRVWAGSLGGAVDVYSQSTNAWQSIPDIANSNRPLKAIRAFLDYGDSIFVVSDFGVSVFIVSRWEFGDTYASFGFSLQPAVTGTVVTNGRIFVGSDQGLAVAPLSSPNLSDPSSWIIYGTAQGLPSGGVSAMALFDDTLLVGTQNGIYHFENGTFPLVGSTSGKNVIGIDAQKNSYTFVWQGANGFTVESSGSVAGTTQLVASKDSLIPSSLALDPGTSSVYVGTDQGVAKWDGSTWSVRVPNGPQSNQFVSIVVDSKGRLWSASGFAGRGAGFYRFDPSLSDQEQWKNFTVSEYPILTFTDPVQLGASNDYYRASLGANGAVWMSSWGDGIVEVVGDSIRRKLNSTRPPYLSPTVATNALYVVAGGAAVDPAGKTWIVNRTATDGNFLAELANDSTFDYVVCTSISCTGFFSAIVIDQNGTKWMANSEPTQKAPNGLYFYNEALTVQGTQSTSGWGLMTISDGLPNNTILSVAVDQDNNVWIGTDLGVTIITDPLNPFNTMFSSFPLREQSIQTIAVDGLNDKWIGTKEGVFVVNSDGTQLLNQYTVINTNGKLVDNDVRSIAIDQQRGIAYIGTQSGLSSLSIAAVQPLQTYASLTFGPNPYTLPNSQPLMISNLVSNSTIKILSINGTLITEFAAQGGGRAFWDGKDRRGNLVATGIYFVVAFADNGNRVANGKVAVVRK